MIIALVALAAALTSSDIADQLARLEGHEVAVSADGASYEIIDIAGDGAPIVGEIVRRGELLFVDTGGALIELRGPLAVPRIAGPGYKVWLIGERSVDAIEVRRIGVLRGPQRSD